MSALEATLTTGRIEQWAALPLPGAGATAVRHRQLQAWGKTDLSLARIAEAHTDALAIMAEAGQHARDGLYGVWASEGPGGGVNAQQLSSSEWRLDGVKQYCSGGTFVTSALVTAHTARGILLFDVDLRHAGVVALPSTWESTAFADTATIPMRFDNVRVPSADIIGGPGWYLERPGFWHGAIGPASCWAGGASALVDAAVALGRNDPHSRAHVGALHAAGWNLATILDRAGQEIDDDPLDHCVRARARALTVRHLVERICTEVMDRFGRATGPQLLAFDAQIARQHAALALYIRQCHAERDLEALGTLAAVR